MKVWITRTEPGASRTASGVRAMGLEAVVAPLLAPEAVEADPPAADEALIFTSPNGVRFYGGPTDRTAWCVGEATAEAARAAGFADVRTGPGDVEGLIALLHDELDSPAVHWGGAHVRGDLAGDLAALGHTVRRTTAYRARAVAACPAVDADIVLFHSPRAAEVFVALCGDATPSTAISISPAADAPLDGLAAARPGGTESALVRFIADRPTDAAILESLRQAVETGSMRDMTEPTDYETVDPVLADVATPALDTAEEPVILREAARVPKGALLATGLVASILGALGGAGLVYALGPHLSADDIAPVAVPAGLAAADLDARIAALESADTPAMSASLPPGLERRIAALESAREDAPARETLEVPPELADMQTSLEALAARVLALETARARPEPDDETLPGQAIPAPPPPATLPDDASAESDFVIDRPLYDLSADSPDAPAVEAPSGLELEPDPDTASDSASRTRPAVAQPTVLSAPAPTRAERIAALPNFPRESIEAALAPPNPRGLDRFIRVRDLRVMEALEETEMALARGDLDAALSAFERLPDRGRRAASIWEAATRDLRAELKD